MENQIGELNKMFHFFGNIIITHITSKCKIYIFVSWKRKLLYYVSPLYNFCSNVFFQNKKQLYRL